MIYSRGDLDMLEMFFDGIDFGNGINFSYDGRTILLDKYFVAERIRLLRLNLDGPKKENYKLEWFELLLDIKRRFSNDTTRA